MNLFLNNLYFQIFLNFYEFFLNNLYFQSQPGLGGLAGWLRSLAGWFGGLTGLETWKTNGRADEWTDGWTNVRTENIPIL